MERQRDVSEDVERLKDYLRRNFPVEFVEYLIYPKAHRDGYRATPNPTRNEEYQVVAEEKWNDGMREVISYDDGTITIKIKEANPNVNIQVTLTREQAVKLTGLVLISDASGILEKARDQESYSANNVYPVNSLLTEMAVLNMIYPGEAKARGVECDFEFNPDGKLLVKGIYLTD